MPEEHDFKTAADAFGMSSAAADAIGSLSATADAIVGSSAAANAIGGLAAAADAIRGNAADSVLSSLGMSRTPAALATMGLDTGSLGGALAAMGIKRGTALKDLLPTSSAYDVLTEHYADQANAISKILDKVQLGSSFTPTMASALEQVAVPKPIPTPRPFVPSSLGKFEVEPIARMSLEELRGPREDIASREAAQDGPSPAERRWVTRETIVLAAVTLVAAAIGSLPAWVRFLGL
jgi:hypothetical protein